MAHKFFGRRQFPIREAAAVDPRVGVGAGLVTDRTHRAQTVVTEQPGRVLETGRIVLMRSCRPMTSFGGTL